MASLVQASGVYPDCASGSLASYEAGGSNDSSCAIGGSGGGVEIIDGFLYSGPAGADSQIQLTPDLVGLGGGFTYSGVPSAVEGQTLIFDISYFDIIDSGPIGSGASLGMDPPFGDVSITESICVDSFFSNNSAFGGTSCTNGDAPQSLTVDDSNPPTSWTSSIVLNPVATFGSDIEIQIVETGGDDPDGAGFDSTTSTQEILTIAPEPVSFLLCLGGLIVIGASRRYLRLS
jgi:hypothetical protein